MKKNIAVLITCHNRKDKTIHCLQVLFDSVKPERFILDVFLVDDGSTDGTTEAVTAVFPDVHIIKGNGSLFWNGGMRLAWETALKSAEFDFFLWLNDDTSIDQSALLELSECYEGGKILSGKEVIVVGACRTMYGSDVFSYGGRDNTGPVLPNGTIQPCIYINGNLVLIPRKIYNDIGQLSERFTHGIGDFDYGLRARKNGFSCYTTRKYVATCAPNAGIPMWRNPDVTLRKRFKSFRSPLGLNISEYLVYQRIHFGFARMIIAFVKSYTRVLFPGTYNRFK